MRQDKRSNVSLRDIRITKNYIAYAEGSCMFEIGNTKVVCTASVEDGVPPFLRGKNSGWVTAEYGMIPRSCKTRVPREAARGKAGGRTHEIQRLIGRAMRSIVDMKKLGERTIWLDCDVIQADGGTRCASINGSFIALVLALADLKKNKVIDSIPVFDVVGAVSVGMVKGQTVLDLTYDEDSNAEVDMNIVMTGSGKFIEVQGTAEREPFGYQDLEEMLKLAKKGINSIMKTEKKHIGSLL